MREERLRVGNPTAYCPVRVSARTAYCPNLVGLGGLEPPTSRLSSARSNQLSYKPLIGGRTDQASSGTRSCQLARPLRQAPNNTQVQPSALIGPMSERKRDEDGGVPPMRSLTRPLIFCLDNVWEARKLPKLIAEIQKGGDPAAGSPTATLLRLHPSR